MKDELRLINSGQTSVSPEYFNRIIFTYTDQ